MFTKEDVHAELCRLCPDFSGCSGRDHARYLGTEVGRSAEQYQWDHVMRRLFARTVEATGGDNGMMVRLFMCRVYVTSLLLFRAQFRCVGSDMVCFSMGESCRLDTVCTRPSEGPISRRTELSSHGGPRGPAHWPQVARCPGQCFFLHTRHRSRCELESRVSNSFSCVPTRHAHSQQRGSARSGKGRRSRSSDTRAFTPFGPD